MGVITIRPTRADRELADVIAENANPAAENVAAGSISQRALDAAAELVVKLFRSAAKQI